MNVLEAKQVTKKVKSRTLIKKMSFTVQAGDVCGFLGPNGSGKTTLMRMFTGLVAPTEGELFVNGLSLRKNRSEALLNLGAIVESPIFFPYLSGRKNLQNLARLHPNLSKQEQKSKVDSSLETVGLSKDADRKVGEYSLGMKQRLGIAQALLGDPQVILLDEPANGLDPMGMRELRELVQHLNQEKGITFFISSHLLDELEQMCNRLIVIREGELIWQGALEELSGGTVYVYKVDQADRALEVMGNRYAAERIDSTSFQVHVEEEEISRLNEWLWQHDIRVIGMERKQMRLEDAFIECPHEASDAQ